MQIVVINYIVDVR